MMASPVVNVPCDIIKENVFGNYLLLNVFPFFSRSTLLVPI